MPYFDIKPVAKPRMTHGDKWKKRPPVLRYYAFKDELVLAANQQHFNLSASFKAVFFMPMPPSWSQKKKQVMAGVIHQQKPDTDNLLKALKDSLLPEDSFVWDEHGIKVWARRGGIYIENNNQNQIKQTLSWVHHLMEEQ